MKTSHLERKMEFAWMAAAWLSKKLVSRHLVEEKRLALALRAAEDQHQTLDSILIAQRVISAETLLGILRDNFPMAMDLTNFKADTEVVKIVSRAQALEHGVLPLIVAGNKSDPKNQPRVILAMADLTAFLPPELEDVITFGRGRIQRYAVLPGHLKSAIDRYLPKNNTVDMALHAITTEDASEPAIALGGEDPTEITEANDGATRRFVMALLGQMVQETVSDVHLEPFAGGYRLRMRVDGSLVEAKTFAHKFGRVIITCFKVLAGANISEKRLPQDGRFSQKLEGREISFRASFTPVLHGERMVLRILDKAKSLRDVSKLGMDIRDFDIFIRSIERPQGLVLITGPTGSGKTTTLYAALQRLNKIDVNILTAEDPVEYELEGMGQLQINPDIGLTFAAALRAFLRQDPDIIMVGECRDPESLNAALKAASTGHMVFSTIHTISAVATIARMVDMGVERYHVASSTTLIIAQRLVRAICPNCKQAVSPPQTEELMALGLSPQRAICAEQFMAAGCALCNAGYKGRLPVYELLEITPEIKELIQRNASEEEILAVAQKQGMKTLRETGLELVAQGLTTLDEVIAST